MTLKEHEAIIKNLFDEIGKEVPTHKQLKFVFSEAVYYKDDFPKSKHPFEISNYVKLWAVKNYQLSNEDKFEKLYWDVMKWESTYLLDSFLLYMERLRKPELKFYMPRRKTLKQIVDKLQMLEDDELDELFIHLPARVGKTQLITMAMCWHIGRNTELSNLYCTYKEEAGGAFLDGLKELIEDPTYCFLEIFPKAKIVSTNAKENTMDLQRKKKYKSISGKGLTSGLNGLYDANGWLVADDIIEGIQDVLSVDILHRKQIIFDNNLMKRKKEGCKVIYNGTIWSLHDIYMNRMQFLENNPAAKDIRFDVIKIPALDPNTDESNFDYEFGVGYSTKYYRQERAKFEENDDMASWFAQGQQEPIERDGALFNPEHMRFYNGVLPDEEPIRKCAICDVALGGSDYLCFPVAYVYADGSTYIPDVVFDNSEKHITQPKVVDCIISHDLGSARFESNAGGEGYKDDIDRILKEKGKRVNLSSKYAPTRVSKEQRIWDKAEEIREFYYLDDGYRNAEYRKFMMNLYSFTINGKNKHDDAADGLSQLADFVNNGFIPASKIYRNVL